MIPNRKLVQQIKERVKNIPKLSIPLETDYLIIETDGNFQGWRAMLKARLNKYSDKIEEKICAYQSEKYKEKGNMSSIDAEVLAIIYGLNSFKLSIINKNDILVRIDCEAIIKFPQKINQKASSKRRWLNFMDTISIYTNVIFEYIKGKDSSLADQLNRLNIKIT